MYRIQSKITIYEEPGKSQHFDMEKPVNGCQSWNDKYVGITKNLKELLWLWE